jgi:arylsulfatase A-like enzyme
MLFKKLLASAGFLFAATTVHAGAPNIVYIYADDLGYGDVSCYGATAVRTPNIDRLAAEGLRFTDAHATSSTCTPSRYSLLSGEYAFRKKGTGILPGDAGLILNPATATLPSVLKKAGYATACVGKWHLGLGPQGGPNWNGLITPGPREVGFDYSFIMAATGDRVPSVYVENGRVRNLDPKDPLRISYEKPFDDELTGAGHPELLTLKPSHGHNDAIVNGISRIGFMTGGKAAQWIDEDMADTFTQHAVSFLDKQSAGKPFFLYLAPHDIHVPRVPNHRFVGKTTMGPRGDAIVELDWIVGEIRHTLERRKLSGNTLIVFSSDNGPVVDDGYLDGSVAKLGSHRPGGPFRGGKYSAYEAGTRVPFITFWPGHIAPGVSDALISQVDLFASFADLAGQKLGSADAPDSLNVITALLGTSRQGRTELVEHSGALSLRDGTWKYIEPSRGAKILRETNIETGQDPLGQLFDLSVDPGERKNVILDQPEKARAMAAELSALRQAGRSRPLTP